MSIGALASEWAFQKAEIKAARAKSSATIIWGDVVLQLDIREEQFLIR